jgi:hypothetical protein
MQNKGNVQIGLLGRAHQTRIVDAENELLMVLAQVPRKLGFWFWLLNP